MASKPEDSTTNIKRTRRTISAAEKAQTAVDVLNHQIEVVRGRIAVKEAQINEDGTAVDVLQKRLQYALANPDLLTDESAPEEQQAP